MGENLHSFQSWLLVNSLRIDSRLACGDQVRLAGRITTALMPASPRRPRMDDSALRSASLGYPSRALPA